MKRTRADLIRETEPDAKEMNAFGSNKKCLLQLQREKDLGICAANVLSKHKKQEGQRSVTEPH